jgi:hypothetical protein
MTEIQNHKQCTFDPTAAEKHEIQVIFFSCFRD